MARGRQQKWICKDCKAEFQVQGQFPKFCCACGSQNIGRAPSAELVSSYDEKRDQLKKVCAGLNPAFRQYIALRAEYDKIMAYWKQQKRRGYISREEYEELAIMFDGAKQEKDPNPADTATT